MLVYGVRNFYTGGVYRGRVVDKNNMCRSCILRDLGVLGSCL